MIFMCKHCFDILGYDKFSTKKTINPDCEPCNKGLRKEDLLYVDDLMVDLVLLLNKELDIKTHYSCIGHYVDGTVTETYIVVDNNELNRYLFEKLTVLKNTIGVCKKQTNSLMKIVFTPYMNYSSNIEFIRSRVELMDNIILHIKAIVNREEKKGWYESKKKIKKK